MNISGDENSSEYKDIKEGLEQGGMKLPMVISNVVKTTASSSMGEESAGAIPMTIRISEMDMVQIAGDDIQDIDMSDMVGKDLDLMYSTMGGVYTEDSNATVGSTDVVDEVFREMLFFIQTENHWSKKTLKKGDSFETKYPLEIPLPGSDDVSMDITTVYTVTKVKKGMAYMSVSQEFGSEADIETDEENVNFSFSGDGKGEIVYNIEDQFVTENRLNFQGKLIFSMMGLQMEMDVETDSDQTITKN